MKTKILNEIFLTCKSHGELTRREVYRTGEYYQCKQCHYEAGCRWIKDNPARFKKILKRNFDYKELEFKLLRIFYLHKNGQKAKIDIDKVLKEFYEAHPRRNIK